MREWDYNFKLGNQLGVLSIINHNYCLIPQIPMTQFELMQKIAKYLAILSAQIEILNSNNELGINTHAENLMMHVLNIVYDLGLRSISSDNFPAIDLLDDTNSEKRVAYQITSTSSIEKIKDCIEVYFRRGIYKMADELNVYVLKFRQKSYSQQVIDGKIEQEIALLIDKGEIQRKEDIKFSFTDLNIQDSITLYRKLNEINDLKKIYALEQYLKLQFEKIEKQRNLKPYYSFLENLFYEVVMENENGMTLKYIYTEPSFSILNTAFKKNDKRFENIGRKKFYSADSRYKVLEFVADTLKGQNHLELRAKFRLILLLGYPGQGKSSFCKRLLNQIIKEVKEPDKRIFYFPLRNIRSVSEFVFNPMPILYEEACEQVEDDLDKFTFNKSILILDGLDELYMKDNLKLEEIDKLCMELARAIDKHKELKILMTSRYGYVNDEKLTKEPILFIQLAQFDIQLQIEWLAKFKQFHPGAWMTEEKLKAFNSQGRYRHIKELIEQPLLLHMVASAENEIEEDTNKAKIYDQLFNELIERKYAKEGQLEIMRNIRKEDLRELIRETAFAIYESGNEYITRSELVKLNSSKQYFKLLPENSLDSVKGLLIAFYFKDVEKKRNDDFIEDKHNYAIEFLHKSLREYLTAEKIFVTICEQFLDKRSNGRYILEDSQEALKLLNQLFGMQEMTMEIINHLNEIVRNAEWVDKEELTDRLVSFLGDFVKDDFYGGIRFEKNTSVIENCINTFYGYWYLLSCLGVNRNYWDEEEIGDLVIRYLKLLCDIREGVVSHLDFSFQIFDNNNLNNLSFEDCTFKNTIFNGCEMEGTTWVNCTLDEVNMDYVSFTHAVFIECSISNSSFKHSNWDTAEMYSSVFEGCSFSDSTFLRLVIGDAGYYEEAVLTKFENCSFNNAKLDPLSLKMISENYKEMDVSVLGKYREIVSTHAAARGVKEENDEEEEENEEEQVENDQEEVIEHPNYKRIIIE